MTDEAPVNDSRCEKCGSVFHAHTMTGERWCICCARNEGEARIARLTELARRVWEAEPIVVAQHIGASVSAGGTVVLDVVASRERALDALEAALLVLSGENETKPCDEPRPEGPIGNMIDALRRSWWMSEQGAAERAYNAATAWVEQLASEWEAESATAQTVVQMIKLEDARELRERAKRGSE